MSQLNANFSVWPSTTSAADEANELFIGELPSERDARHLPTTSRVAWWKFN